MLVTTQTERPRSKAPEQRKNQRLREHFDAAVDLLRPLLQHGGAQQGALYFRALSKLHENYPDMTQAELEALVVAVMRALNNR